MVQDHANSSIINSDDHATVFQNDCPGSPGLTVANDVVPGVSAHDIFIWISIGCTAITVFFMIILMTLHLVNYTVPKEQKFLLRLLALPAIYAIFNMLSIIFYGVNVYLAEIPKICEAIAIASLFELFAEYVTPKATREQRDAFYERLPRQKRRLGIFWQLEPENRLHEKGSLRWYNVTQLLIFQYIPVSILLAILQWIAAATQCPHGKAFQATKLILEFLGAGLISLAIYGLIEYERRMKVELRYLGSKRKLWGIKLFVGVSVSLNVVFAIAQRITNIDADAPMLDYFDITIGVPDVLFEFCMLFFTGFFFWAFAWGRYRDAASTPGATGQVAKKRSPMQAVSEWITTLDIIRGVGVAFQILTKLPFGTGPKGLGYTARGGAGGQYSPERKPVVPKAVAGGQQQPPHENAGIGMEQKSMQELPTRQQQTRIINV